MNLTIEKLVVDDQVHVWSIYLAGGKQDKGLRNKIVELNSGLVNTLTLRYRDHSDFQDLVQVARMALIKAVEGFDPKKGLRFSSYATKTVNNYIRRFLIEGNHTIWVPTDVMRQATGSKRTRLVRMLNPKSLDAPIVTKDDPNSTTTLHDTVGDPVTSEYYQRLADRMDGDQLLGLIRPNLSGRQAKWLELRLEGHTMREIAKVLGISLYICQSLERAVISIAQRSLGVRP